MVRGSNLGWVNETPYCQYRLEWVRGLIARPFRIGCGGRDLVYLPTQVRFGRVYPFKYKYVRVDIPEGGYFACTSCVDRLNTTLFLRKKLKTEEAAFQISCLIEDEIAGKRYAGSSR